MTAKVERCVRYLTDVGQGKVPPVHLAPLPWHESVKMPDLAADALANLRSVPVFLPVAAFKANLRKPARA